MDSFNTLNFIALDHPQKRDVLSNTVAFVTTIILLKRIQVRFWGSSKQELNTF